MDFVHAINTIRARITALVEELLSFAPNDPDATNPTEYTWIDTLTHASDDTIKFEEVLIKSPDFDEGPTSSATVIQRKSKYIKSLQSFFVKSNLAMGPDNRPHSPIVQIMESAMRVHFLPCWITLDPPLTLASSFKDIARARSELFDLSDDEAILPPDLLSGLSDKPKVCPVLPRCPSSSLVLILSCSRPKKRSQRVRLSRIYLLRVFGSRTCRLLCVNPGVLTTGSIGPIP